MEIKSSSVTSAPSKVTVYTDRAMVARTVSLEVEPGEQMVRFEGLPVLALEDSLRVTGGGTARSKVTGLDLDKSFLEHAPEAKVSALETKIEALGDEVAELESRAAVLESEKSFLESIKVSYADRVSKDLAVEKPSFEDLGNLLKFLEENFTTIDSRLREIIATRREKAASLDALKRELSQIKSQHRKESRSANVSLSVATKGTLNLELTYVILGASWTPVYDVRLLEETGRVELAYRAVVRQKTGEDWSQVDLSLSTARPSVGASPPELSPWYLQFPRRVRPPAAAGVALSVAAPRGMKRDRTPAEDLEMLELGEAAEVMEDLLIETAQVDAQSSAVVFSVTRKEDVPSDGLPHNTTIALEEFDCRTEYISVPKLSPYAYLKAEITNGAAYPLLSGRSNVFRGANFVGNADMKVVAPSERFKVFFGIDESIRIKRHEMQKHKEALLIGKNRMTHRYRIEIENFKKRMEQLQLLEQLPVSKEEEIKVKLVESVPEPEEKRDDGRLKWTLDLPPGEKIECLLEYQIEYPKDKSVAGL